MTTRGRRRRWGVLLASAGFHVLLALGFGADLSRAPPEPPPPPPVVDVWLVPRLQPARPRVKASPRSRSVAPIAAVAAGPTLDGIDALPVAGVAPAPAPAPPAPLRGLVGCGLATFDRLAPEARARCLERLAMLDRPRPRLNLDLSGRYAHEATPYLARPPKNGCKPVAGVVDSVNGTVDAKIGVGCAFAF